jgi:hypothetical protein
MPEEIFEECSSCGCEAPGQLTIMKPTHGIHMGETYALCKYCYGTAAGKAHEYPGHVNPDDILRAIAGCSHELEAAILEALPSKKPAPPARNGARDGYCEKCRAIGLQTRDDMGREERIRSDFTDDYRRALVVPIQCTNKACRHTWTEVYIYSHSED